MSNGEKTHDHREPWDTSDVSGLRARYEDGESVDEIADHMGRTYSAIRSALYRYGIKRR